MLVVSNNVDGGDGPLRPIRRTSATVIGRGDTKMSIRLRRGLQVDLRVVPAESFGAALQYFTGSKDHNVILRGMAKDRGLKINEYGVFRVKGDKETYDRRPHRGGGLRHARPARAFRRSCAKAAANSTGPPPASCPS